VVAVYEEKILAHRDARLTDEDVLALCGWAERLRASTAWCRRGEC
jgi:hypothetical protein